MGTWIPSRAHEVTGWCRWRVVLVVLGLLFVVGCRPESEGNPTLPVVIEVDSTGFTVTVPLCFDGVVVAFDLSMTGGDGMSTRSAAGRDEPARLATLVVSAETLASRDPASGEVRPIGDSQPTPDPFAASSFTVMTDIAVAGLSFPEGFFGTPGEWLLVGWGALEPLDEVDPDRRQLADWCTESE